MGIDKEVLDKLIADYKGPDDLIGEQGLLKQLTKDLGSTRSVMLYRGTSIRQTLQANWPACLP
jgi:hypothetical protein